MGHTEPSCVWACSAHLYGASYRPPSGVFRHVHCSHLCMPHPQGAAVSDADDSNRQPSAENCRLCALPSAHPYGARALRGVAYPHTVSFKDLQLFIQSCAVVKYLKDRIGRFVTFFPKNSHTEGPRSERHQSINGCGEMLLISRHVGILMVLYSRVIKRNQRCCLV